MPPWHTDGNWMALQQSLHFLRGSRKRQDKAQRGCKLNLADSTSLCYLWHVDSWNLIFMETFQADNLRAQAVFTRPRVNTWGPGFLLLLILGPNPGRPAPTGQWRQGQPSSLQGHCPVESSMGSISSIELWKIPRLSLWRVSWIQTQSLAPKDSLCIGKTLPSDCFRDSLFSLFASLISLYFAACLLAISPDTLNRWNCPWIETVGFGVECPFPSAVVSRMPLLPTSSLPLKPLLITGLPKKWCHPLDHLIRGGSSLCHSTSQTGGPTPWPGSPGGVTGTPQISRPMHHQGTVCPAELRYAKFIGCKRSHPMPKCGPHSALMCLSEGLPFLIHLAAVYTSKPVLYT